jgi:hypothetical protein
MFMAWQNGVSSPMADSLPDWTIRHRGLDFSLDPIPSISRILYFSAYWRRHFNPTGPFLLDFDRDSVSDDAFHAFITLISTDSQTFPVSQDTSRLFWEIGDLIVIYEVEALKEQWISAVPRALAVSSDFDLRSAVCKWSVTEFVKLVEQAMQKGGIRKLENLTVVRLLEIFTEGIADGSRAGVYFDYGTLGLLGYAGAREFDGEEAKRLERVFKKLDLQLTVNPVKR